MAEPAAEPGEPVELCASSDLVEGGDAVGFDLLHEGQGARAFAVRFEGRVHAYLNRCAHVPMEMDWRPNRFFDDTGRWLLCATHGAAYAPDTGSCAAGPCRGGLVKIRISEHGGTVRWHTADSLQPVVF